MIPISPPSSELQSRSESKASPTNAHVVIVSMEPQHLAHVMVLENASFPDPWSKQQLTEEAFSRADREYFVALIGEELVGYVGVSVVCGDGHIDTIAVVESCRRQGIGTQLVGKAMQVACERDAEHVILEVDLTNDPARQLYARFGFAPLDVRRGYYDPIAAGQSRRDALVMGAFDIQRDDVQRRLESVLRSVEHSSEHDHEVRT